MGIVIRAEELSKMYHIGKKRSGHFREAISERAATLFSRKEEDASKFWALKDASFEVQQGEVLGIIGRNGAGKSTLLKILSRITEPTEGRVEIEGRVASLLEVGTGFHPELTGRENIFMNGAILGMKRAEIKSKFDEIVSFSGIEQFIDTPVKRYSSGMYVRLAFAVAAHLEPEILIVDEVLAVGDAEFQRKCLGKMKDVSEHDGRTVIFVSHNMEAVSSLTQSCLFLDGGKILFKGKSEEVISSYLQSLQTQQVNFISAKISEQPSITKIEVKTSDANQVHVFGKLLKVNITVNLPAPMPDLALSFQFVNGLGHNIVHAWYFDNVAKHCTSAGSYEFTCDFPQPKLYKGRYRVNAYLSDTSAKTNYDSVALVCPFEVTMYGMPRDYEWQENSCAYLEDFHWDTKRSGNFSSTS